VAEQGDLAALKTLSGSLNSQPALGSATKAMRKPNDPALVARGYQSEDSIEQKLTLNRAAETL